MTKRVLRRQTSGAEESQRASQRNPNPGRARELNSASVECRRGAWAEIPN